jgi:hypothetical protein
MAPTSSAAAPQRGTKRKHAPADGEANQLSLESAAAQSAAVATTPLVNNKRFLYMVNAHYEEYTRALDKPLRNEIVENVLHKLGRPLSGKDNKNLKSRLRKAMWEKTQNDAK